MIRLPQTKLIVTALTVMLVTGAVLAKAESFDQLNPQVILLSDKPRKIAWYPGITLAKVLIDTGGLGFGRVYLVRNGVAEKIKLRESLNRALQPWDIIVVTGHQPGPRPGSSPSAAPKSRPLR